MTRYGMALLICAGLARGQAPVSYTAGQAEQGKAVYAKACASCHGENLDDGEFAPPLKGAPFMQKWGGKAADEVFNYMSTRMPPDRPNGLGGETYAQVLAFVLSNNRIGPGTLALPSDAAALKAMRIPGGPAAGPGGGLSPGVSLPPAPKKASPLDKIRRLRIACWRLLRPRTG